MKAFVVFESMFGNTEAIAAAIVEALRGEGAGFDVEVADVTSEPVVPPGADLLVLGGPTHAFSMTRPSSRADAVRQGADHAPVDEGLREWIDSLPADAGHEHVAAFDTKLAGMRHLPGSAAKAAARAVRAHGFDRALDVESFYVEEVEGPLLEGEIERARAWALDLVKQLVAGD